MAAAIDYSKVVALEDVRGEDAEETAQLRGLADEARAYLSSFRWCGSIRRQYFGLGVADIVGVFLFEIEPKSASADNRVWVVVGDIPSAYLVVDDAPNPASALDAYIGEMMRWVDAAKEGRSIDGLIPVNVEPTPERARDLESRLAFIDKEILSRYQADLAPPR